mgnify:CR=1 FL=1
MSVVSRSEAGRRGYEVTRARYGDARMDAWRREGGRKPDPTRLEIETVLTDPEAFLAPYTIKRAYTPMPPGSRFEEYLCENNRDL